MKIMLLAPQPFFSERGTPIAVDLMLQGLSARGDQVDVLTYHLGADVHYEGVSIHRIPKIPFIQDIKPGFSWKKVILDLVMFLVAIRLFLRGSYQIIHAVEEAVFIALLFKKISGVPYVYDMDSSLSEQMMDRHPMLFKPVSFLLAFAERLAIRNAKAVVPVCDALSENVGKYRPEKVLVLRDISLLDRSGAKQAEDLRSALNIDGPLLMYVGNLEPYQGIDLLLESFSLALRRNASANLVVIGGKPADIEKYTAMANRIGIADRVHFLGPKPVDHLAAYLGQADVLVSPRVEGVNTPMKVFSYLDSGKALLATRLPTHTQVLNNEVAMLADPTPRIFSRGVLHLLHDRNLRHRLGQAGQQFVAERHTFKVFQDSLNTLYDWLQIEIDQEQKGAAPGKPTSGLREFFR